MKIQRVYIREYYPKKTDLTKIEMEELIKNIIELNNRPRKMS